MNILLIIISSLFILLLPGFICSLVFYNWKEIDIIERLCLSLGLSIIVMPLIVFITNLLGVGITLLNIILQVIGLVLFCIGIIFIKHTLKIGKRFKTAHKELYKSYKPLLKEDKE